MKFLYVVHTTSHPSHAWVFASEKKAKALLFTLQNGGGEPSARLTKAPLNPSQTTYLRSTVSVTWEGNILSATTPAPFPTTPPEPIFDIVQYQHLYPGDPWATCRLETSKGNAGIQQARDETERLIADMKQIGLWPANEEEAKDLMDLLNTPKWFQSKPTQPDGQAPPGLLSELVICPACNTIMAHESNNTGRSYICPGKPQGELCANPRVDAEHLEGLVLSAVLDHRLETETIMAIALQAERAEDLPDQKALNKRLAAHAIESAQEILTTIEKHSHEHAAETGLRPYTEVLTKHLTRPAADGSSTARAIADTAPSSEDRSQSALQRHARHSMTTNPSPDNRRTMTDLVRIVNPTPGRETLTWRLRPRQQPFLMKKIDSETYIEEVMNRES